jgi:hypothetical protein
VRDELDRRVRVLDAERLRPLRPCTAEPVTREQGRANFIALAEALGGLLHEDLELLHARDNGGRR